MHNPIDLNAMSHLAKSALHLGGASLSSLALVSIAATVTAAALSLLAWDALFLYTYCVSNPLYLLWVVPTTIAFLGVEIIMGATLLPLVLKIFKNLAAIVQNQGDRMLAHYRAFRSLDNRTA